MHICISSCFENYLNIRVFFVQFGIMTYKNFLYIPVSQTTDIRITRIHITVQRGWTEEVVTKWIFKSGMTLPCILFTSDPGFKTLTEMLMEEQC